MPVIVQGSRIYNLSGNVMVQVSVTATPTAKLPPLPPLPSMPWGYSNFIPQFTDNSIGDEGPKEPIQDVIIMVNEGDQTDAGMDRIGQIGSAIEEGSGDLGISDGSMKEEE